MSFTQYEPHTTTSLSIEPINLLMSLDSELPQVTVVIYLFIFSIIIIIILFGSKTISSKFFFFFFFTELKNSTYGDLDELFIFYFKIL